MAGSREANAPKPQVDPGASGTNLQESVWHPSEAVTIGDGTPVDATAYCDDWFPLATYFAGISHRLDAAMRYLPRAGVSFHPGKNSFAPVQSICM